MFRNEFLEKYFPEDVHGKKEIELLELKQGNMTVADYAGKFEALVKFFPHYNRDDVDTSKCLRFENGLRLEIKQGIGYQYIRRYVELVNKSRIYDENSKIASTHYKSLSEKKGKGQFRGNPYVTSIYKVKQDVACEEKPSGGETPAPVRCYKCGVLGHRANQCQNSETKCFKCGKWVIRMLIIELMG